MNGESRSHVASLPKIVSASSPTSVMASSAKETHCLKENLDQNMKQERLINHQFTFLKINLKYWLLSVHTLACMQSIHYSACINHSHSVNLDPQLSLFRTWIFNEIWDVIGFVMNEKWNA
jgi:hypothetical protein